MFVSTKEQQTNILEVDLDLDKPHIFSRTFPLTGLGSKGWRCLYAEAGVLVKLPVCVPDNSKASAIDFEEDSQIKTKNLKLI